jgi:uncharacterized protein DUF4240
MDIDRFWDVIDKARAIAGEAADQAIPEGGSLDDHPMFGLGLDGLDAAEWNDPAETVEKLGPDASTHPGEPVETDLDVDEDDPVARALIHVLARLDPAEIVGFERTFDQVRARADRANLAQAAALIEPGYRDEDGFRAGLVALGRVPFEAALRDPDSLAEHPLVREIAAAEDTRRLGREELIYAAGKAYSEATGRDEITFFDLVAASAEELDDQPFEETTGEGWDRADEAEIRRRLPRLSALFAERRLSRHT